MSLTRPPAQPPGTLWGSLVQYYRSCLEREQEFSIRVPEDPATFVLLRDLDEHLISHKAVTTILTEPVHTQPVLAYLNRRGRGISGTFIYGYPLVSRGSGLVPLCYTEVRLEPGSAPNTVVLQRGNAELLVNRHFLRTEAGLTDAEVDELLRQLRSPKSKGPDAVLEEFLLEVDVTYSAVLFGSEASAAGRGPMRELQLMEQLRKDRLPDTIRIFIGEQGVGNQPKPTPGLTIVSSDPGQDQVLQRRRAPFLVVTGPMGSGKTQAAINLIASAVADGQRVLYVNQDAAALDRVFRALTTDNIYPGVWRAGGREARLESLKHARTVVESLRTFSYFSEDPQSLARESLRLGQEIDRLDAEIQEIHRLEALIAELSILNSRVEESLHGHPLLPAIRALAERITPETAGLFSPGQLPGIRQLVCRLTGRATADGASIGGKLRGMMLLNQVRASIKQLGLPEFCTPDGDLDSLAESLSHLEQAFPLLLARARLMHARGLRARFRTPTAIAQSLQQVQQTKIAVDRKRLNGAWLQVADKLRPTVDQIQTMIEQEEKLLATAGTGRVQGRSQLAELLKAFPVTLSQTLLVAGSVPNEPELFDLLIVDDASTVEIPSFLPVLYRAKRVCLLGDEFGPKHRSYLGDEEDSRLLGQVNGRNLAPFAYVEISVLDRAKAVVGADQVIRLNRQYQSAPSILQYTAEQFYGSIIAMRPDEPATERELPLTGFRFDDVPDGRTIFPAPEAMSQAQNPQEAMRAVRLVTQAIAQGMADLVVVTPFRGQAMLIAKLLSRLSEVESDTNRANLLRQVRVATMQTLTLEPRRAVLLSLVAAQGATPEMLDWLEKNRWMINQAASQATDLLIVVGHRATLAGADETLAALVAHADRLETQGGNVRPLPPGLQPERFGLLHTERNQVAELLSPPDSPGDCLSEAERELYDRLGDLLRGRPALLAPRLSLTYLLEPQALAALPENLRATTHRLRPLLSIVQTRSLRPVAVLELEDSPAEELAQIEAACRLGNLPLIRVRSGHWQLLHSAISLIPAH